MASRAAVTSAPAVAVRGTCQGYRFYLPSCGEAATVTLGWGCVHEHTGTAAVCADCRARIRADDGGRLMEITQDELADKLGGLVADPEFTAAHVFAELNRERALEASGAGGTRAVPGRPGG